jgi:hypothetical protein
MDNDAKLLMFLEALGDGVDIDVAQSVLEAHNWDLQLAISMMTGAEPAPTQAQPAESDGVRSPMRTGYTDTLMAPTNPQELAALERAREEAERQRKVVEAEEKKLEEEQRHKDNVAQAEAMRKKAEREAHERRQRKRQEELDALRLQADPEAMRAEQERKEAAAAAEMLRQQQEIERRQREEARIEAEAKAKHLEAEMQARRRQEKEQADIRKEREDAEKKAKLEQSGSASPKEKEADELASALVALKKRYQDSDAVGLLTCLQTLRKYVDNLAQNPVEPKFQRINTENASFQKKVAAFDGAIAVLKACGFREDGNQLAVESDFARSKTSTLWNALTKVDLIIAEFQKRCQAV